MASCWGPTSFVLPSAPGLGQAEELDRVEVALARTALRRFCSAARAALVALWRLGPALGFVSHSPKLFSWAVAELLSLVQYGLQRNVSLNDLFGVRAYVIRIWILF